MPMNNTKKWEQGLGLIGALATAAGGITPLITEQVSKGFGISLVCLGLGMCAFWGWRLFRAPTGARLIHRRRKGRLVERLKALRVKIGEDAEALVVSHDPHCVDYSNVLVDAFNDAGWKTTHSIRRDDSTHLEITTDNVVLGKSLMKLLSDLGAPDAIFSGDGGNGNSENTESNEVRVAIGALPSGLRDLD